MAGALPARAASSARNATPALSTRVTAPSLKRRASTTSGSDFRHSAGIASRTSAPVKRKASPSRATLAGSDPRIGVDLAAAQVTGDLADRLAVEFAVELL